MKLAQHKQRAQANTSVEYATRVLVEIQYCVKMQKVDTQKCSKIKGRIKNTCATAQSVKMKIDEEKMQRIKCK